LYNSLRERQELHSQITQKKTALQAEVSKIGDANERRHKEKAITFFESIENFAETEAGPANNLQDAKKLVETMLEYCKAENIPLREFDGFTQIRDLHKNLQEGDKIRKKIHDNHRNCKDHLKNSR